MFSTIRQAMFLSPRWVRLAAKTGMIFVWSTEVVDMFDPRGSELVWLRWPVLLALIYFYLRPSLRY